MSGALKILVDIDTSKAKKGLQSLAKETSQSIAMLSKQRDVRYNRQSEREHQKQTQLVGSGGKGGLLTSMAMATTAVINAFQLFNKEVIELTTTASKLKDEIRKLDSEIENATKTKLAGGTYTTLKPDGSFKSYSGDTLDRYIRAKVYRRDRQQRLHDKTIGDIDIARKSRSANIAKIGKNFGGEALSAARSGVTNLAGRGLSSIGLGGLSGAAGGAIGALGTAGLIAGGVLAAVGGTAYGYNQAVKSKVNEGAPAQAAIEKLNVSLGTLSKNFTGFDDVSGLTDEIMLLGVNGVNSVLELSSAASTLMMAFEGNQSAVSDWLPIIDDLSAATGMTGDNIAQMIARMGESEYVESRVFNTLATRGIPIYEKLAEVMGVTAEEAKKMAKASEVSSEIAQKALRELGEVVKGTSANLSSMTMEGAQASFKASGELEHAGWAKGYNQKRISYLNELTDEQMRNAEDIMYQVNSEGAGRVSAAMENGWQSFVEWMDGAWEWTLQQPADWFGYTQDALESGIRKQIDSSYQLYEKARGITADNYQDEIDNMRKMLDDSYSKLSKYNRHPDVTEEDSKYIRQTMVMLGEQKVRLQQTYGKSRELELIEQREKSVRDEYARIMAEKTYDAKKQGSSFADLSIAFNDLVKTHGFTSMEDFYRNLNRLNREFKAGIISETGKADWEKYTKMSNDYQSDFQDVLENNMRLIEDEERLREEEARERKELIEKQRNKIREDLQARIISGEYSRAGQLRELEQRWAIDKMESLTQEEKDNTYDKWLKNERERSLLQIAASTGNKTAAAELGLSDQWRQLNEYVGLTDDERAGGIHGMVDEQLKELAKETLKGVLLGFDSQTGEAIYGLKQGPKEATTGYISNVWGASCRTFMKFEKDYDRDQFEELKRNTKVNEKTAESVRTLAERFTVAAQ